MAQVSQFGLLGSRRFLPFFVTQFLAAFNDNLYKNALQILIAFPIAGAALGPPDVLVNVAAALFVLPYFLFSATAGQIADKLEKSRLMRGIRLVEILTMLVAALALWHARIEWMLVLIFMLGTLAAFFGPVKYAIMPQHLSDAELVGGNALVDTGTFVAILIGLLAGGALTTLGLPGLRATAVLLVAVAIAGYLVSRAIPRAPATAPDLKVSFNIFAETWRNIRIARGNRPVFLAILGISWFWMFGSMFIAQLPNYTRVILAGSQTLVIVLTFALTIGIGLGSLLCERLSGRKIEIGLVPFGSIGLSAFSIDLYFAFPAAIAAQHVSTAAFFGLDNSVRLIVDLIGIGAFGGFFTVPLYAMILSRTPASHRARIIACNNIVNALFMVGGGLLAVVALSFWHFNIPQLFLLAAVINAGVAIYIYTLVPEFLMRFLTWIFIHVMYRIRTADLDRIPQDGAAVLVSNHVSLMDALVIGGMVRRPVRFVMDHNIFRIPVLSFIFRTAKAIPIAPAHEDESTLESAFERIDAELADGNLVCVFPEGKLTRDGNMNPFKSGIERIIERRPVPVVPLALKGLWGSFFSRSGGAAMKKLPRRFWSRIALVAGEPVPASEASAERLQARVAELRGADR
jgi:1-acyl-sn-glycerol-3-phosphate acyltransferase